MFKKKSSLEKEKTALSENRQYLELEKQIEKIALEARYLQKQQNAHYIFERELISITDSTDSSNREVVFKHYEDIHKLRLKQESNKYKL
jgi:hypothetical protein